MKFYVSGMNYYDAELRVRNIVELLGHHCCSAQNGELVIGNNINGEEEEELRKALKQDGFKLLPKFKADIVDDAKKIIIDKIHNCGEVLFEKDFRKYLSKELGYKKNSNFVADVFVEVTGIPIYQFILYHKIELVKKMLVVDRLSLTDIAEKLKYKSVPHLSAQFKKVANMTVTAFLKTN